MKQTRKQSGKTHLGRGDCSPHWGDLLTRSDLSFPAVALFAFTLSCRRGTERDRKWEEPIEILELSRRRNTFRHWMTTSVHLQQHQPAPLSCISLGAPVTSGTVGASRHEASGASPATSMSSGTVFPPFSSSVLDGSPTGQHSSACNEGRTTMT